MSSVDVRKRAAGAHTLESPAWRLHAAFAVAAVGFGVIYAGTFGSLVYIWAHSGLFEYGFLIFPICLFLAWLRRERLRRLEKVPQPLGLVPLGLFCLLWLTGAAADVNLVRQFSVVAMIPCLVFTFYGATVTRGLMFPLAYMFFAVPVGNFLVGPLQDITARLSVIALQITNVPVFVDGRLLMTPAGTWKVEEACSGIKFFFATIAFGVLYANLFYRSWHRRLIFIACAIVVPVIANGLRVYFTILIGEYFGMEYATGTDHLIFGWQFFGTVLVLLFFAGWPWHESETRNAPEGAAGRPRSNTSVSKAAALALGTLAVLVLAPLWLNTTAASISAESPPRLAALPDSIGGMTRVGADVLPAAEVGPGLVFRNADAYARARYGSQIAPVHVLAAAYGGAPDAEGELVTHGNRLFDAQAWKTVPTRGAPGAAPNVFKELELVRRHGEGRWLVWYVYRVGERPVHSKAAVKIWQVWNRLLGRAAPSTVVALATQVTAGAAPPARERLEGAAADLSDWMKHRPERKR